MSSRNGESGKSVLFAIYLPIAVLHTSTRAALFRELDLGGPGAGVASVTFSADGSVVAGGIVPFGETSMLSQGTEAFHWTPDAGVQRLGDLAGGGFLSLPSAVSNDGQIVVGSSESSRGRLEAFRWTVEAGLQGLGRLTEGATDSGFPWDLRSMADGISGDGLVVVGTNRTLPDINPFRWTQATGTVPIVEDWNTERFGVPSVVFTSGDGTTIIGESWLQDVRSNHSCGTRRTGCASSGTC